MNYPFLFRAMIVLIYSTSSWSYDGIMHGQMTSELHSHLLLAIREDDMDFLKLLFGGSTTLSGEALSGVVLDAATNQPLEKVVVTVEWNGSAHSLATSQIACIHAETTLTDAQGRFHFNSWKKKFGGVFMLAGAGFFTYKKGFENTRYSAKLHSDGNKGTPLNNQEVIKVKPFVGSAEERIKHLRTINPYCISHDSTFEYIVIEEHKQLAVTKEQKEWVKNGEKSLNNELLRKALNKAVYEQAIK